MQNSGGVRKFFSVFSWGTKIFCLNFMGYDIFLGILEFHSAQVPGIESDQSLISYYFGGVYIPHLLQDWFYRKRSAFCLCIGKILLF